MRIRVLFVCLTAIIFMCPAHADTLVLKSGSTIDATIIERTNEKVIVDIQGVPITYYVSDIESINNASLNSPTSTDPKSANAHNIQSGGKNVADEFNAPRPNEPGDTQAETISETAKEASLRTISATINSETAPAEAFVVQKQVENFSSNNPNNENIETESIQDPETASTVTETTTRTLETTTGGTTRSETLESTVQRSQHPLGETAKPTLNVLDKAGWSAFMGMFAGFFVIFVVLLAAIYVFSALCLQIIATKTNAEPSWLAWIPFANVFLMCKIGGLPYWWCFVLLAPFIPFIGSLLLVGVMVFMWYKIAIARGKPGWLGILTIIPLANLVIMGYLAFTE